TGLAVLDVDADVACSRVEDVLGGHADVRGLEQMAAEAVLLAVAEPDLLGADADGDSPAAAAQGLLRDLDGRAVVEPDCVHRGDRAREQVRDPEEAGDEGGLRVLVELSGRPELLDPA